MHNLLVQRFKGFIIPPRPDKKFINNTDDKFVEERRVQMEKYLSIIMKHPVLGNSSPFKVFTQSSNDKFDIDKTQAESSQDAMEYRNFEDMYDKLMSKFQNKFEVLFSQKILPFSKEISNIEDKILRLEGPMFTFSNSFSEWIKREEEATKSFLSLNIPDNQDFSRMLLKYHTCKQTNVSELGQLFLEIQEEQLRLEGLKLAVNSYKLMIDEYSQQETLISRKLAKHRASADEDTASRYLSEIQLAQDSLDKVSDTLSKIEKNIIDENTDFDTQRSQHITATLRSICMKQYNYYETENKLWNEINLKDKFLS